MQGIKAWFKGLTLTGKVTAVAVASILSFGTIGTLAQPSTPQPDSPTPVVAPAQPQPKVETKTVTTTEAVGYSSSTVNDANLVQGATEVRTAGINGVRTHTFEVIYTDSVETARKEISNIVTAEPVNEVIAKGTKAPQPVVQAPAQPSCPNGTYVNTYGNTVCRPYESSGAPTGATAQCEDGTYSFSQSRRGTCSHHGGVAIWL